MDTLSIEDLDTFLLQKQGKIIHQIWFGLIPTKREAKKAFQSMKMYRESWIIKNPSWFHFIWNYENCLKFIRTFYPEHHTLYNEYKYLIQKCDVVRYFILHRYGGMYVDMDYFCNKPFDHVLTNSIYFVETPNKIGSITHISNSLMYSVPNHPFWRQLFIDLEFSKNLPIYYGRHLTIMFSTGPGMLNRSFHKWRYKYKLNFLPQRKFHPYGLDNSDEKISSNVYAIHIGKGSWEEQDSKFLIFIYQEYQILLFIIFMFGILLLIDYKRGELT